MVQMVPDSLMVFSGNANPKLAQAVVQHLNIPLGRATVSRFSDGEVQVELNENVRGRDVFIIQPTCQPTNDNLMELVIMVDALRRASAARITAVIPYYGYARQDRRPRSTRVAISAKVVANMLQAAGIDRVLTMDLHADQIQGFFDVPVDNIYASPILLGDLWKHNYSDLVVVSPGRWRCGSCSRRCKAHGMRSCNYRQAPSQSQRFRSHEYHRRNRRPHLRNRR